MEFLDWKGGSQINIFNNITFMLDIPTLANGMSDYNNISYKNINILCKNKKVEYRNITQDELKQIAIKRRGLWIGHEFKQKYFNKHYYTIEDLIKCIVEFEKESRIQFRDNHHIYYEGMFPVYDEENDRTYFVPKWGS